MIRSSELVQRVTDFLAQHPRLSWQADDGVPFPAAEVARRLGCSIDLVREREEIWGIAKVLARDERGRPTRITYPKPLFDVFLRALNSV